MTIRFKVSRTGVSIIERTQQRRFFKEEWLTTVLASTPYIVDPETDKVELRQADNDFTVTVNGNPILTWQRPT